MPQNHHFRTDHLLADLKGRSVRGGTVTLTAQAAKLVLYTASTVILARLLTPDDFGLIAMVTAITGFVSMFKDAGLSMATIQRPQINHAQVSTLFWINVGLSVAVMLIAAGLAPVVAWFYGEPRLVGITLALAGTFLFGGLTVQHQALLRRQMRFRQLAIIEILSLTGGIVVAVVMALYGCRYWSLVGFTAATALTNCALVLVFSGWWPGAPVRGSGVRPMLGFGGSLTAASFFNQLREHFPFIVIGQALGSAPLGIYERAYRLLVMPLTQMMPSVSAVAIPALSRLQGDDERFRRTVRRLVILASGITVPFSVICVLTAPEIVRIMLGEQWDQVAVILALLSPLAATQTVSSVAIWCLTTTGHGVVLLRFAVINTVLVVSSVSIGLQFGMEGAALAFSSVGLLIRTPILFVFVVRHTPVTWQDVMGGGGVFIVGGVLLGIVGIVVRYFVLGLNDASVPWAGFVVGSVVLGWLPLVYLQGVPRILADLFTAARHG